MLRTKFVLAALVLLIGSQLRAGEPLNVELLVTDGAKVADMVNYPVKVGVPLALGAYEATTAFRLVDSAGQDVPAQFDVLARYWPASRSIRGVLVSFNAAVTKGGVTKYYLRDDGKGKTVDGLKIDEAPDAITVVTGPLKVAINTRAFNVLDKVWYDASGQGTFADGSLVLDSGGKGGAVLDGTDLGSAKKDVKFSWDYRGPVYACLKAESTTEATPAGWGFVCRIHFYKDQGQVLVDYTLKNSAYGRPGHHLQFKSFVLTSGLKNLGDSTVRLGGAMADNAGAYEGKLDAATELVADAWKHASANGQPQKGLMLGYADVSDGKIGVLTAVRKMSYLWPCGIKVSADKSVAVELWPAGQYLLPDGSVADHHELVDQARRSHQVLYCFHPGTWDAARVAAQAKVFELWPVAFMKPAWYSKTRAFFDFGGIVAPTDEFDAHAAGVRPDYPADKDGGETGWWNWGGAAWRRVSSTTGGMPGDLTNVMASGNPATLYRGDDIARHHAEMRPMWCDDYQYPRDAALGFNATYPPNVGLRKPTAPRDKGNPGTNWTSWDDMHPWVYEVGDYYWYTGEKFAADYLVMHADYLLNFDHFPALGEPGKQPYWSRETAEPMHIIMDAYKVTGERRYWDYIRAFAENVIATKGNDYGIATNCGFQHGLISAAMCELYFLLPERTAEEKELKERIFQFVIGTSNGQFYWGGGPCGVPNSWGWAYYWEATKDKYTRPDKAEFTVQCLNELGFTYLLTGQKCYRDEIGLVHVKPGKVGTSLDGYGRVARAAWNFQTMKQANPPEPIKDLKADSSFQKHVQLSWTSTGGNQLRVFYATKPIVEKREKFVADLDLPITSADPAVCDVYDAQVVWTDAKPAAAGQKQTVVVGPLPESLIGQKVHFAIESLNVGSEADIGRSWPSNCVATKLSGDKANAAQAALIAAAAPLAEPGIFEVSCQSPTLLYVITNTKLDPASPIKVGLVRVLDGKEIRLTISKVELETVSGRMLAVTTTGLEQGADYVVSYFVPLVDSAAQPVVYTCAFRAHVGRDRWSPARKITFGPVAIGDYECFRSWDGDYGCNYPQWQWGGPEGKIDPTTAPEENLRRIHTALNKSAFGEVVFRMRVNPLVTRYRFVALCGDKDWPPHGGVSLIVNAKVLLDKVDIWTTKFAKADQVVEIHDGELEVLFTWINYLELYPQYKWQEIK